jgi:uncharacterized protein (TIGR02271 family)
MNKTFTGDRIEELHGLDVYDREGDKIGSVDELFVDQQTGQPEWIGLGTGFFGTKRVLVPFQGADVRDDGLFVPYDRDRVKDTPEIDSDRISQETEQRLYAHYGLGYSERRSDTGLPEGASGSDDLAETMKDQAAMTRSEEELRVGKREEEMGRLRVHKWVETEQVDVPVDVRREKARVTREPVDETVTDEDIGDDSLEVTLSEERPVVEKETVAKERIGIEKDVETDTETVSGEIRKERVEVDESEK